jgi:spore maturation protein CgeB
MARFGFSPATRVFEAAGGGACLISDDWEGIETFFEPGKEILVASSAEDIVRHVRYTSRWRYQAIGAAARARVRRDHTYARRAADLERISRSARPEPSRKP